MNKNLEELKKIEDKIFKTAITKFDEKALTYMMEKIVHCLILVLEGFILVLEGFEKRLKTIEDKMGLFPLGSKESPKEQQTIKSERMDRLEIGAQIGKPREGPKPTKSGQGIRPKTKRPKPKPRPKIIHNVKIGLTDPD